MEPGTRVRSTSDGQAGTTVEVDGKLGVRIDRGDRIQEILPYRPDKWVRAEAPKLPPLTVARICYAAVREYRVTRGEFGAKAWNELKNKQAVLIQPKDPVEAAIYNAVKAVVE